VKVESGEFLWEYCDIKFEGVISASISACGKIKVIPLQGDDFNVPVSVNNDMRKQKSIFYERVFTLTSI